MILFFYRDIIQNKMMNLDYTETYKNILGQDTEFHYAATLPLDEKISFVVNTTNAVANEMSYLDFLKDICFNYNLIRYFTDIDSGYLYDENGNADFNLIEQLINTTDLIDKIRTKIDYHILTELESSVDHAIMYKTGINKDSVSAALTNAANATAKFVTHLDEHFGEVLTPETLAGFTDMSKKISALNESDLVNKLIAAIHPENKIDR